MTDEPFIFDDDCFLIEFYSIVKTDEGFTAFIGNESFWDEKTFVISGLGVGKTSEAALLAASVSTSKFLDIPVDQLHLVPAPKGIKWTVYEKK